VRLIRPADLGRLIVIGLALILTLSVSLRALDWLPFTLPFLVVGAMLAVRRPTNPIGWLLLGLICALALATEPIDTTPAAIAAGTAGLSATALAVVSASVAGPMIFVILQVLTLVLPAGTFPTGTWGRRARVAFAVEGIVIVLTAFSPTMGGINFVGLDGQVSGVTNPLAIAPEAAFWGPLVVVSYLVGVGLLAAGAVSMVVRARRSTGTERLQFRWIVSALVLVTAALLVAMATGQFILAGISITLIPISIGIAVTRYRLYDIDRIVSRTISYLVVTLVLAVVFVGAVLGFGALLAPVLGENPVAVAASTLVVAALFQPLRSRVQRIVDRRFNRARYDAQRTAATFSDRLRDEVDLARIGADLTSTVEAALRPAGASLWVRDPDAKAR
jgi:hypothetical protein